MTENPKKRIPVKRWIILILVLVGIYAAFIGPGVLRPIAPLVVLPGEETGIYIIPPFETSKPSSLLLCQPYHEAYECSFPITNTILGTLLADLVLILISIGAYRFVRRGNLVPKGFYNFFEWIVEMFWNMAVNSTGKWARKVFPLSGTIFLLIFTANMIKLIPGFESVGYMKEGHGSYGYKAVELIQGTVWGLDKTQSITSVDESEGETETVSEAEAAHSEAVFGFPGAKEISTGKFYEVVPWLRGSATDLNFTLALAIATVVMVQVYGVMAMGPGYFQKYFQFNRLVNGGPFGVIDFGVGFLEIILEFAKILSFAFRLFGNIFAGALLLSIVGALTAVVVPVGLYIFEVFFGIIQAYVFSLLALVFVAGALVSHNGEEHHEDEHFEEAAAAV